MMWNTTDRGDVMSGCGSSLLWDAQEVIPGLFLGSEDAACGDGCRAHLHSLGVTHILVAGVGLSKEWPTEFEYKVIPAVDLSFFNMVRYFPESCSFIDDVMSRGLKVLVHCARGVSRSASIVAAYLIFKGHTRQSALHQIKLARKVASPSLAFIEQLDLWQKMGCNLTGTTPAHLEYRSKWETTKRTPSGGL
ncbi:dual specificity protein phosphatase 12 [Pelomyxa schiedti]|nr:dual specificity protein phosphatase 12 [Pelomyxa schiedti]